ncbi:MAG: PAS domain S-box protein, partial [Halorientalis sp.]
KVEYHNSNTDAVLHSTLHSETFFVNSAVEDLYGITPEEAAADTTNWLEHVHPDDRAQLRESVDEQIQGTIEWPVEQEFRVQHPERGQRWIQSRLDVIRDAEGTPVRIAGVATDITEHKERERDLRVRTRTMDEAPIGITITDPSQADNPIIYANDRFLETTGYDREAVLGRNCRFLQGEKTDPETVTEMRDAIDAEQPVTVDVRNYRQDGMLFWNHLVIAPVENEAGEVTSFVGFQQDVTERKARQEKLAASESRFRAVFESSHDALVIADDDGVYVDANPAACELFGVEYEELLGQRVSDFAPEDFDFETAWREFLESDSQRGEFPLERPDGDRRIAEFSATTNVQPGQHLSALRDVTARKAREREIERQNERLELLASTISHDLRNPLRSAQTNLRMAQRECESDLLDDIDAAHERMAELIDDLLTLARQGQAVTETEPVDLAAAAQEAWEGIETAEATLVTDAVTAQADRSRLLQVFENLFVNAISHGREDVTVRVGPTDHGFFVADDGPGVPDDEREYVFEYGYSNAETGTGFGLAIVAEIAQAHGWTVELTDSDTGGARFEFET